MVPESTNSTPGVPVPAVTLRQMAIVVVLVVVAALGFRASLAWIGNFGPEDLEAYERTSGVDLPDRYGQIPFFLTFSRWDGQAYMTIGADPFFQGPSQDLLSPVYRFGRAGYPWLARLAVFGTPALVPVGLVAVNLVAVAVYTTLVMRARFKHPRALWLLANPALFVGFATDTAEPLAFALLMLAVVSASRVAAVAAFGLGLTRASYATVLGTARRPALTIGAAAVAAIVIRIAAAAALGQGFYEGSSLFTWPMLGYFEGLGLQPWPMAALSLLLLAVTIATFLRGFRMRGAWVKISWVSTGLMGMCLSYLVTNDVINIVRALGAMLLLWALAETESKEDRQGAPGAMVPAI